MSIRVATKKDKEQVLLLIDQFDSYYGRENIFPKEFLPFIKYKNKQKTFNETVDEWMSSANIYLFVAEENRILIGYICGTIKERLPRVFDKEGFIEDWYVNETWRGKGVGTQLYKALLVDFKTQNCTSIGISAYAANKNTIAMYHRMGFIDKEIIMVKEMA